MALPYRSDGYIIKAANWNAHVDAINTNTSDVASLDGRVTTAEGNISSNDGDISTLDGRIDGNDTAIGSLNTAVGMPYSNASDLASRVAALESGSGGGGGGSFGAWQTPTLNSGWSSDGYYASVRYRTIPGNRTEIVGALSRGAGVSDVAFQLDVGYRPVANYLYATVINTGETRYIRITDTGEVALTGADYDTLAVNAIVPLG